MYGRYTCLDCGRTFDNPLRYEERHGLDRPPYERWTVCPHCGGPYVRTILCEGCNQPITGDYIQLRPTGEAYCDRCFSMRNLADNSNLL